MPRTIIAVIATTSFPSRFNVYASTTYSLYPDILQSYLAMKAFNAVINPFSDDLRLFFGADLRFALRYCSVFSGWVHICLKSIPLYPFPHTKHFFLVIHAHDTFNSITTALIVNVSPATPLVVTGAYIRSPAIKITLFGSEPMRSAKNNGHGGAVTVC